MSLNNKYNNSKIYAVYCPDNDDFIYIGSTSKHYLCSRLSEHRSNYKRFIEGKVVSNCSSYKIFDYYGVANCKIKLLEHVNCETRRELAEREAFHIKNNTCVNKLVPYSTVEEKKERITKYYQDNKEMLISYQRRYNIRKRILNQLVIELVLMSVN